MSEPRFTPGSAPGFTVSAGWLQRLFAVLAILLVTRLGMAIPLPGLDPESLQRISITSTAWSRLGLFALGMTPFITAWVLLEIFRGDRPEQDVARYRRWLTAAFAMFQGWGIAASLEQVRGLVLEPGFPFRMTVMLSLTAGTMLLLWLGEQITKTGFCDGVWLVVATLTIAELPRIAAQALELVSAGQIPAEALVISAVIVVALVTLIVVVELAYRPLRLLGLEAANDNRDHDSTRMLRLRINPATVLPAYVAALFAALAIAFLSAILVPGISGTSGGLAHLGIHAVLLVLATFLVTALIVSPRRMAARLRNDMLILEEAPPSETAAKLDTILTRLAGLAAAYLIVVCVLPDAMRFYLRIPFDLGGPALIIVVIMLLDVLSRAGEASTTKAKPSG